VTATYRGLLAVREFRVLVSNVCIVLIAVSATDLALGVLIYRATGSTLFTSLSTFGGPLVALVGSQFLSAMSDVVRPRTAQLCMTGTALAADLLQCIPGQPWQLRFVWVALPWLAASMFSGAQWVIIRDAVDADALVLARSTLNLVGGGVKIAGYALGGIVLVWIAPSHVFVLAAVAHAAALVNLRLGIRDRPARGAGDRNVVRVTAARNRQLLGSRITRPLYLALWVPNGLVVGCESLFVPVRNGAGAGYLFGASCAGMMLGDLAIGRFMSKERRDRLIEPLRLLLAVPYLGLAFFHSLVVVVPLVFVASIGFAASLPLLDRLHRHTDPAMVGQVMGLFGQGLMVWQSLGALLGGAVGLLVSPDHAVGIMAAASVTVTLLLARGLRRSAPEEPALAPQPG